MCFKSKSGTYIDLILTNQKFSFKPQGSFEAGLSDQHCLIHFMLKLHYTKLKPVKYLMAISKNLISQSLECQLRTFYPLL